VTGWSLEQDDRCLDKLGNPIGVKSYKPPQIPARARCPTRPNFKIVVPPHSYMVFKTEE
jgi:hypothetical protein